MKDSDEEVFLNIFRLCESVDGATFKINLLELLKKYKNNEKIKKEKDTNREISTALREIRQALKVL